MQRCLVKLNAQLRDFNTRDVVEAANVYRSRGVEDKAANIQAVDDHLRDLRQQKKRLEADILAQWEKRDPEGFALKGETESEIRTREARQSKEAETSRKRDAPDASGFTLTGSDRQVDEAEARGQKPMFARGDAFYSELSRQIGATKSDSMPPAQWKAYIKNLKGVKGDEIEWSGINDWLDLQSGKVTKAQILAYLDQNGVKVEETMLGDDGQNRSTIIADETVRLTALGFEPTDSPDGRMVGIRRIRNGERFSFSEDEEALGYGEIMDPDNVGLEVFNTASNLGDLRETDGPVDNPAVTKFDQWVLPGGKDYRELLLTLPERKPAPVEWSGPVEREVYRQGRKQTVEEWTASDGAHITTDSDRGFVVYSQLVQNAGAQSLAAAKAMYQERVDAAGQQYRNVSEQRGNFRSSHFDQPNILAHVRFDERTDKDGKRVLFIEEIQSDWAQKGKREGFQDPKLRDIEARRREIEAKGTDATTDERKEWAALMNRIRPDSRDVEGNTGFKGVPPAPFVGKTEAWVALAVKRMVRYAAENGFDRVAFTTGEQQADRYDLSKQVDAVRINLNAGGTYQVGVRPTGREMQFLDENVPANKLAEMVGKDLAERIIAEVTLPGVDNGKVFRGLDLKIGGEGMKQFYDKIIPNVVNDVLKKLGGGRVGIVGIAGDGPAFTVREEGDGRWQILEGARETGSMFPTREAAEDNAKERNRLERKRDTDGNVSRPREQPGFDITPQMRDKALGGMPLFNRAEAKSSGMSVADIRAFIEPIVAKWANAPDVTVIASMEDAPKSVRQMDQKQLAQGATGRPFAFFHGGQVFIIASEIRSEKQALEGLYHEALGHYGLRGVFGDKLDSVLLSLASARSAEVAAKAKAYGLDILKREDKLLAAEEVLAELAQKRPEISFVRKAIAAIRSALREMGVNLELTDDEIIRGYILPAREFVERGNSKSAMSATTFHRAYHGTPHDFDKFDISKIGTGEGAQAYGYGLYFAGRKEVAEHYKAALADRARMNDPDLQSKWQVLRDLLAMDDDLGFDSTYGAVDAMRRHGDWKERWGDVGDLDALSNAFEAYEARKKAITGRLYEVELTPKEDDYLAWDKPLSGQSDGVFAVLDKTPLIKRMRSGDPLGSEIYKSLQDLGSVVDGFGRGQAGVSKYLASLGIPGIKYLDGSSRNAGSGGDPAYLAAAKDFKRAGKSAHEALDGMREAYRSASVADLSAAINEVYDERLGHHNYVIFDDKHVEVTAKFARTLIEDTPKPKKPKTGEMELDGQPGNRASWDAPEPTKMDRVLHSLQDRHIDTKQVLKAIRGAGQKIADSWDVYLQEELYHGRAAKRTQDFIDREMKPLVTEMAARKVEMADLEKYLHARHAEEANKHIAERNGDMLEGGSGMTTADAKKYLSGLDDAKKRAFEALATRIDSITKQTRETLVSYGLESRGTINGWAEQFKHYVPLQREDMGGGPGNGQGFSVRGSSSKSRTGSKRQVVDILANIAMQRERAITRGEKNRVANALVGLAQINPNPDFWKVDQPPMLRSVDEKTGQVVSQIDPQYKSRDNVVMARMPDGKGGIIEHAVVFNDRDERAQRMALALKNLDMDSLGHFLGASAKITRYFASINTQYNPVFGVVNFTRDVQGAMFNLTSTPLAGKQAAVAAHLWPALRGIYSDIRSERKGKPATSSWAQLFEEFQEQGGQTGFRDMFADSKERAKALEREIKRATEGRAMGSARAVFDWLSDYNTMMENAVRLATYKVAIDSGISKPQAASLAKNITVNFNRKGQIATQAGALYAFFNASVQGTARLTETLTGPKGRQIMLGGILLGSAQAALLAAFGFEDDEPPEFVRERALIFPIGGKKYITIPMPLGLHVLPNIGRLGTQFALGGFRDKGKHATNLIGVFAGAFNPVGSAGFSLQTISPTPLDPLVALGENRDWTGKPIARKDFSASDPSPGHTRAKNTASKFGKWTSQALNWATGGTAHKPGAFSPTPDQIDYLIGQATGGVGREIMKVQQSASSLITGEKPPEHKLPLVGRFYGNAESQSSQGNRFYENLRTLNGHQAEIEGRRRAKEPTADYLVEYPEARLYRQADYTQRQVSSLQKRKRELMEKDAPKDQVKLIEERIAQTMTRFNERVTAARR